MTQKKNSWIVFLAITFPVTWGALLVMYLMGYAYGSNVSLFVLAGCMFVPAVSSLITRRILGEGYRDLMLRLHFKKNIRYYALAWFGPAIMILLGSLLYFAVLPGNFDPNITVLRKALEAANLDASKAQLMLIAQIAQGVLIGPIINIVPTLGEELGWRAYLLPRLSRQFSMLQAILLSGVIWGIWHAPMIAMGHNYGKGYWGAPWTGILMMTVFCVFFGAFISYLTLKTGSVIPAAAAHSGLNALAGAPIYLTVEGANMLIGPIAAGLLGGVFVILSGAYFLIKAKTLRFEEPVTEDQPR